MAWARRARELKSGRCSSRSARKFPYRFEHRDTGLAVRLLDPADQALVDQAGEHIMRVRRATFVARFGRRQPRRQQYLHLRTPRATRTAVALPAQQFVTPIQRVPERLLPLRKVTRPAAQQSEPVAQLFPQRLRREEPQTRRREFDGQGQAVQSAADLGNSRGVVVGQSKSGRIAWARSMNSCAASQLSTSFADARLAPAGGRVSGGTG